ncbi:MAG: hypothetical protein J7502_18285, partial [Flavisolibacter sp.]|nr:hypothetical protein [Flavisolibacter sp.]
WWNNAWTAIEKKFSEIRAVVMFNTSLDHYNVDGYQPTALPWKWSFDSAFQLAPASASFNNLIFKSSLLNPSVSSSTTLLPENMRAVGYDKGVHWFRNVHTGSVKVLKSDIRQMKALGINTVLRSIPDIYSRNFFKIAEAERLCVIPRLWVDLPISKLMDADCLEEEKKRLLHLVKKFKEKKSIIAWNLSNDVLYQIETSVSKPDRYVYQTNYIQWLQQLIKNIKQIDGVHPVTVTVIWNDHANERMQLYNNFVGDASEFFLNSEKEKEFPSSLQLPVKFSWRMVDPSLWDSLQVSNLIIPSWQDQQTAGFASLNGILDLYGRKKQIFDNVNEKWNGEANENVYTAIKILRPIKLPFEGQTLVYHALVKDDSDNFVFATKNKKQIRFEWYLVHTDPYGNELSIKPVGNSEMLALKIPAYPQFYYLYLEAISDNRVTTTKSPLGLPLDMNTIK